MSEKMRNFVHRKKELEAEAKCTQSSGVSTPKLWQNASEAVGFQCRSSAHSTTKNHRFRPQASTPYN